MREKHKVFDNNIEQSTVVWRYFDLPKFISLLQNQALYFSRADLLGDPLEGSFTKAREVARQKLLENPPNGKTREQLETIFKHNASIYERMPKRTYINCWHMGNHESMAMWRGYGGGIYGVAIRSVFGILAEAIPAKFKGPDREDSIFIGRVKYIDYASQREQVPEEFNVFAPFVCKSLVYEHEKEVRAMFNYSSAAMSAPPGFSIEINLQKLIQGITISPLAPRWFKNVIENICEKYGFDFPVEQSRIAIPPIY